jgi:hypothetical protein
MRSKSPPNTTVASSYGSRPGDDLILGFMDVTDGIVEQYQIDERAYG